MATKKTSPKKSTKKAHGSQFVGLVTLLDGTKVPAAELAHIAEDLRPLAVALDALTPDPRNARLHGAQNLDAIARSLTDNGQLKALSTDADGVILAGNGTYAAAVSLGWKWIARVRCNLTGPAARRWAIQDNRTAELAEWDQAELQNQLAQLEADLEEFNVEGLGFTDAQIEALMDGDVKKAHGFVPAKLPAAPKEPEPASQWKVIIDCRDEAQQAELIEEFEGRGLKFTAPSM